MTDRRISVYSIIPLALLLAAATASSVVYSLPPTVTNGVGEVEDDAQHVDVDIDIDTNTNIIIQTRRREMKTLSNKPPDTTKITAADKPHTAITTADLLPVKHRHRRAKSSKRGKRSKKSKHNLFDDVDCKIDVFKGQYLYTNGCVGKSYAVDISCSNNKRCIYEEHSVSFNSLLFMTICYLMCVFYQIPYCHTIINAY